MSLGFREERKRKKRRFRWTLMKWVLALCLIGAAGIYAYQSGSRLAESRIGQLQQEIESLSGTVDELRQRNAEQLAAVAAEKAEAEQWRQRYEEDVPKGELKTLFDLLRGKLSDGVKAERLRFVISAAANKRECDRRPEIKRFIVRTPLYRGSDDTVWFADGSISVTASGVSARDAQGNPEAWFDPAQPITVRLSHIGGKVEEFSGTLPLQHSTVIGNREYRFNLMPAARGFVQVAADSCRYP